MDVHRRKSEARLSTWAHGEQVRMQRPRSSLGMRLSTAAEAGGGHEPEAWVRTGKFFKPELNVAQVVIAL